MRKDEILKLYSKYKLYIFPAIVALSSLILISLVIYPQAVKLIGNQIREGDLINKFQFLSTKAAALESYDVADLSRKVSFALNIYPSDKDFGNAIGLLQQITSQNGFSITDLNFSLGTATMGTSGQSYALQVQITGPSSLFPRLLNSLENNSSRLMRVNTIETSSKGNQLVSASLGLELFYSALPATYGSADTPLPEISQKDEEILASFPASGTIEAPSETVTTAVPKGKLNPFE